MTAKRCLTLGVFFLLAGCGTIRVNIDYGNTPLPGSTDTPGIPTSTPTPSVTPTSTVTQTATAIMNPNPTEPQNGVVAIAAGRSHTCAVTEGGAVKCWGANDHGQLGNGTMVNSNVPVEVSGLAGVKAVTAGWGHTCALTVGGGVKCWGYDLNGELGNGTSVDSDVPVDVTGLSAGVAAIDAGDDHTCAVTGGGGLKCWGYNEFGQLGDGTKASRSVPVDSQGFAGGVAGIAAGWGHTCVRTTGGGAKCWGDNEYGQLGDGETVGGRLTPVDVTGLGYGVLKISAEGGQSCALTTGGGVSCWGINKYGQLGDGSGQQRNVPVQVIGLTSGVSDVTVGWNHACAVVSGGGLECWGWNYYGQLGDGTKITRSKPVKVSRLTDGIRDIAVGWAHTCVATGLGAGKCWGSNATGQLGDGTQSNSGTPLAVVGLESVPVGTRTITPTPITPMLTNTPISITPTMALTKRISPTPLPTGTGALAITAGLFDTCALTGNNIVMCWGENTSGQLGEGSTANTVSPGAVRGLSGHITAIATSGMHTCALTEEGTVKCWGENQRGELGDGTTTDRTLPVDATVFIGIGRSIALGMDLTCVLTDSGGVKCWGSNRYGQLGNGTNTDSLTPVDVIGLTSGVTAISAGLESVCAVTDSGAVKCWGYNLDGQLGDGTTTNSDAPVSVAGLSSGVVSISVGWNHTCAMMVNGGVKCWGENQNGQLGNGTNTDSVTPVDVIDPGTDYLDVKAGDIVTCALTKLGGVKCWGYSLYVIQSPAIGECSPYPSCSKPVDITGLSRGASALAMGWYHVCIINGSGEVICWGNNGVGQLGDGTREDRPAPGVLIDL